ncbi:MAG: TIGR03560 family F420-dependent LLM class oxidoreductase [Deltaproteobacteria bacterium]|nr:TIGR03560 family F420-dependent LLM class oxidoreductase [Deltaproteobacteria bacterium]
MGLKLGVHTGPQILEIADLKRIWRMADEGGLYWASVWDHFYANPLRERADPCFEGVASMAALAASTERLRVGCLVFCALFRNPGLLAKSAVTIDHLSDGRCELGVGAGWFEEEFSDFGYAFPPLGERLDQLEEALTILRALLREGEVSFKGRYYEMEGAVCSPRPRNPGLRIWVGGRGPKRTPRIAARFADGFNVPYPSPDEYAARLAALDDACADIGRDGAEIERSVNVAFLTSLDPKAGAGRERSAGLPPGVLVGGVQQAIDRIGEYERAGAQGLNIAFRPPIDWDAYQAFLEEVVPAFHR